MTTADVHEVIAAALRRADALAAGDADGLTALLHPSLRWTTFTGDVLTRDEYVTGNTAGGLTWRSQRLHDPVVVVVGDTAVLTAVVTDEVRRGGHDETNRLRLT